MTLRDAITSAKGNRSAFLLGAVACGIFYMLVCFGPLRHTVLHTYTTEHVTEFAITGLFFWANADLLLCFLNARRQRRAAQYNWLPRFRGMESVAEARPLLAHMDGAPMRFQSSMIARRLDAALEYIAVRKTTQGYREYLDVLAGRDSDDVYDRYAFPRFVTTMLPILGLLGTVVHFGSALSGLSIDKLAERVPEILSGMGTAFNTTCAALSASTSTMLLRFVIERVEESVVHDINKYVEDNLLYRFQDPEVALASQNVAPTLTVFKPEPEPPQQDLTELLTWLADRDERWMKLHASQLEAMEMLLREFRENGIARRTFGKTNAAA